MQPKSRLVKLSTFWLGPLLAGACLGIGHGTTQRIWIMYEESRLKTTVLLDQPKTLREFKSKAKTPFIKTQQTTNKTKEKIAEINQANEKSHEEKEINALFQTLSEP